ncbi:hypothetical protein [Virgibacillus subterraneus]|uniref:hypothetical protein n=1 Tax=Virgibacillus subterraneus TaxID=621109 RepID=UPI000B863989|nr:hypothetical protein [Virgibacillus subterraneus]
MIKKFYLVFILIALFTLIGCSQDEPNATVTIGGDYQIGESLESLAENSDLIVLGEYQNLEDKWNMARNRQDPEKESTERYLSFV